MGTRGRVKGGEKGLGLREGKRRFEGGKGGRFKGGERENLGWEKRRGLRVGENRVDLGWEKGMGLKCGKNWETQVWGKEGRFNGVKKGGGLRVWKMGGLGKRREG